MRGWHPGSPRTPSSTGDGSCKDRLYTRFADLLLEVWEDGILGALLHHLSQGMLHARTYCTLDLLTFSLRYERMAAWEPRTPSSTGDASCKHILYARFADLLLEVWEDGIMGALVHHLPQGMLRASMYCTLDLLTFSSRYERMASWELLYTISHRGCFVPGLLYARFADLLFEVWEDGSLGALLHHLPLGTIQVRTFCTLDLLTFSLRYERMAAWEPSYIIFHWGRFMQGRFVR